MVAHRRVILLPKLRMQFAEFLQDSYLKRLGILYHPTCVGLGYGLMWKLFPGCLSQHPQSNKRTQFTATVTFHWFRNINLIPIDYGFRPRLRGRLTLRRLTLRRKPWDFDVSVFHTHLVTHVRILASDTSSKPHGSPSQAYRMLRYRLHVNV